MRNNIVDKLLFIDSIGKLPKITNSNILNCLQTKKILTLK